MFVRKILRPYLLQADSANNLIRKIDLVNCDVSTAAGASVAGYTDGTPGIARFSSPVGIACNAAGDVVLVVRLSNAPHPPHELN